MNVKKNRKKMDHSGSTFDSFLEEEGIREESRRSPSSGCLRGNWNRPCKNSKRLNKRWRSSFIHRSQLDRLLDPSNVSVTLDTITRAARALGKRVIIRVADKKAAKRA